MSTALMTLMMCLLALPAQAKYSGGTGEPNDPYQIATAADLMALGETPGDYDKHFILTADIDLDPNLPGRKVFDSAVIAPYTDDTEGGYQGIPFSGVFDGGGHTISRLRIEGGYMLGLFGVLGSSAEIVDLQLVDISISGSGYYNLGGLAASSSGKVMRCSSTGEVSRIGKYAQIGGLVGFNQGTVAFCHSAATVNGHSQAGGLVGLNTGEVSHCHSTGAVGALYSCVGGLVGNNMGTGVVTHCHSTGPVWGSWRVGGLVGENWGHLAHCYSTGTAYGTDDVGGLNGLNERGSIVQCYSTGAVSGRESFGGLVGYNLGSIATSYSTGSVSGTGALGYGTGAGGLVGSNGGSIVASYSTGWVSGSGGRAGGLVGGNSGRPAELGGYSGYSENVASSFWDIQTSGQTTSAGGIGATTAEMQHVDTFLNAGWDFVGEIENGMHEAWQMPEAGAPPVLAVFNGHSPAQLRGSGTLDEPYLVSDAWELGAIIYYSPCAHYRLTTDIDLADTRFGAALVPWFRGTFDGTGHAIRNLKIEGASWLGVFGRLVSGAEIVDLGVVNVSITGSGDYIGGLAGYSGFPSSSTGGGTITRCYSTGAVHASGGSSGGLIGALGGGIMTECYSTAEVTGSRNVGGLAGHNSTGVVANCYSTGSVTATGDYVGGLMGGSTGMTNCYSTGAVSGTGDYVGGLAGIAGDVTMCFWDIQTSGQAASGGGVGKTTTEMQALNTFLVWGTCGHEGVWTIDDGNDYPRLWWENRTGEPIRLPSLSDLLLGAGTEDDPFLIYTADQLDIVGLFPCEWDKYFKLMADIDLAPNLPGGKVFDRAVIAHDLPFTGVFDGNGHMILNLTITGGSYLGLFGRLESGAVVRNLGVVDVNITGSGSNVGGLAGNTVGYVLGSGSIANCHSSGTVSGVSNVGGLVGTNYRHSIVTSYSSGEVRGTENVGGLVGNNCGSVATSYSASDVRGTSAVGGLVGSNGILVSESPRASSFALITNCYARGMVDGDDSVGGLVGLNRCGDAMTCFWDTEASGQTTSAGGTGKTTAEMQIANTFLEAGWDFVGETANGTEDIWWILEGKDYPRLWWEEK